MHEEYKVRLTAILTSIRLSVLARLAASLLHYSRRKGTSKKVSLSAVGLDPVKTRL